MTAEEIAQIVEAVFARLAAPPLPRLMYTTKEAVVITGLSEDFFTHEAPAGRIPSRLIRGRRMYAWDDLMAIVAAGEQKPLSGPMAKTRSRT
jgi:hypothetical protein